MIRKPAIYSLIFLSSIPSHEVWYHAQSIYDIKHHKWRGTYNTTKRESSKINIYGPINDFFLIVVLFKKNIIRNYCTWNIYVRVSCQKKVLMINSISVRSSIYFPDNRNNSMFWRQSRKQDRRQGFLWTVYFIPK